MICQSCGEHPATTKVKAIVNGRLTEYALCAACARRLGYTTLLTGLDRGFSSILSDFFGGDNAEPGEQRCPWCGATFEEIARTGKVGCAHCYEVFKDRLLPIIQRLYGSDIHCGKMPKPDGFNAGSSASGCGTGKERAQHLAPSGESAPAWRRFTG